MEVDGGEALGGVLGHRHGQALRLLQSCGRGGKGKFCLKSKMGCSIRTTKSKFEGPTFLIENFNFAMFPRIFTYIIYDGAAEVL